MQYRTILVTIKPGGKLTVWLPDDPAKQFDSIEDVLKKFSDQGWQLIATLPQEWRWLKKNLPPPGEEVTGLELARYWLIFGNK